MHMLKNKDHNQTIPVENLDVHVINSCNLKCFGCNHLADYGYGGPFTANALVQWIRPWKKRLYFKRINLLGGEPLLNLNLKDICIGYRKLFSPDETKLRIVTNGILIKKCLWLEELIQKYHVHIQVSPHVLTGKTTNAKRIAQVKEGLSLLEKWAANAPSRIETKWAAPVDVKKKLNFQVFYQGSGSNIKPFEHDDIAGSKKHCTCKTLQLYKGHLYKCAPIAYIKEVLGKIGRADDPDWAPYLKYKPLSPDCSAAELKQFMEQHPLPEWACKMCPPFANDILSEEREIY
jgi:organic radical activating enzyme